MARRQSARGSNSTTADAYQQRALSLLRRYEKKPSRGPRSYESFVQFVLSLKSELSSSTWRQYRCSLRQFLEKKVLLGGAVAKNARRALARLQAAEPPSRKGRFTSAFKSKCLPQADLDRICAAAHARGARHATALEHFLRAGVLSGLRIVEWRTATILFEDQRLVLVVQNGKLGEMRGNGLSRELRFCEIRRDAQKSIVRWLTIAQAAEQNGQFNALVSGMSSLLKVLCDDLFPQRRRHYALSSTRHQFSAMAKVRFSRVEVAALMGHAVDVTASCHYGRPPRRGLTPQEMSAVAALPEPSPGQVATVRRSYDQKLSRREQHYRTGPSI